MGLDGQWRPCSHCDHCHGASFNVEEEIFNGFFIECALLKFFFFLVLHVRTRTKMKILQHCVKACELPCNNLCGTLDGTSVVTQKEEDVENSSFNVCRAVNCFLFQIIHHMYNVL